MKTLAKYYSRFEVSEKKVWFTGGYWPEGVPHQITELRDWIKEEELGLFDLFLKYATKKDYWDLNIAQYIIGDYSERVNFRFLVQQAKKFGTFLHDNLGIRKGDCIAIDLPNSINSQVPFG